MTANGVGFWNNNLPIDPLESISKGLNLLPTVKSLRSSGFQVGSIGLGKWVGLVSELDRPSPE